jgi:CubicO group peptidase (beta-lactamase class C family)
MSKETILALGFDEARLARVGHTITRDIEAGKYHGASLMVARGGSVVLDLVEGFADRQAGRRLTRDGVFSTMSVAKQFTNVLALSLVERGALRLHAPIAEWLPAFRAMGHEKVNLTHLLTHTSGICSAIPNLPPEVVGNIEQLTAYAASRPLESQPGERVNYSILVGHSVIAALCLAADGRGRTYSQMLEDELFAPLKMRDSSLGLRKDLDPRFCPVKAAWSGTGVIPPEAVEGMNHFLRIPGGEIPGGGCVTTIGDLHRFTEMLRRGGELDGARILSPATIDYAARNHTGELRNVLLDPFLSTRNWLPIPAYLGLGFFVRGEGVIPGPFSNLNSARAFGGLGAGSTAFWVDAEKDLSFALLSTGLIEDSHHMERLGLLSDLVLASMVA